MRKITGYQCMKCGKIHKEPQDRCNSCGWPYQSHGGWAQEHKKGEYEQGPLY